MANYSLNASALNAYINEMGPDAIISKIQLEGSLIKDGATVVSGQIGTTIKVPILDQTINFQDGSECVISASGSTTFTQVPIEIQPIADVKEYCPKKLAPYLNSLATKNTANPDGMDPSFEEKLALKDINAIRNAFSKLEIMGAVSGTFSVTSVANGLMSNLLETSNINSITRFATGTSSVTLTNAVGFVETAILNRPENLAQRDDVYFNVSPSAYDTIILAYVKANMYHFTGEEGKGEWKIPGFNMTLKKQAGLSGKNYAWITYPSNIIYATPNADEVAGLGIEYSVDNPSTKVVTRTFNAGFGVAVAIPQDVMVWYQ